MLLQEVGQKNKEWVSSQFFCKSWEKETSVLHEPLGLFILGNLVFSLIIYYCFFLK